MRPSSDPTYNWDRLMFNIAKLSNIHKYHDFSLGMLFVINGYNYHQIPDMIRLSKQYQANIVCLNEMFHMPYDNPLLTSEQKDKITWGHRQENYNELLQSLNEGLELAKYLGQPVAYQFPTIGKSGVQ